AQPILASLGLSALLDGHRRANASFSAWGGDLLLERNAAIHLEGPGRVIDRRRFEAELRAAAVPCTRRMVAALEAAEAADGYWRLRLADGDCPAARFLVDASGRAAAAVRRLATRRRDDRLVAACAFLPHADPTVEPTPATMIEAVP